MRSTPILSPNLAPGNTQLSPYEIATYYRYRLPAMPQRGRRWRWKCPVHQGDGLSFSVDSETGCWYCHSQCGRGGDVIDLERALTSARFRDALREIGSIIERDLIADRPRRPRYSRQTLQRAEMLRIGLLWRIDKALAAAKGKLFTSAHKQAADLTQRLTAHEARVRAWSAHDAAEAMPRLSRDLARECISEVEQWYRTVSRMIASEERAA